MVWLLLFSDNRFIGFFSISYKKNICLNLCIYYTFNIQHEIWYTNVKTNHSAYSKNTYVGSIQFFLSKGKPSCWKLVQLKLLWGFIFIIGEVALSISFYMSLFFTAIFKSLLHWNKFSNNLFFVNSIYLFNLKNCLFGLLSDPQFVGSSVCICVKNLKRPYSIKWWGLLPKLTIKNSTITWPNKRNPK